ncbi:MAG: right-handed parallel beta-helix repeat-containing protein [Actinomycetota bacterium]|nr:right-handed parallel beta-helix repeat-containing protein [Actinomycetota bacterium]
MSLQAKSPARLVGVIIAAAALVSGAASGVFAAAGSAATVCAPILVSVSPPPTGGAAGVVEFAAGTNGTVPPVNTVGGPRNSKINSASGIAEDANGFLYVVSPHINTINVFSPGASGDVAPFATLAGTNPGLNNPQGIVVRGNKLYVANGPFGSNQTGFPSVAVFDLPLAAGVNDVAPSAVIAGSATKLNSPFGLALDSSGNIFVANLATTGGTVTEYAPPGSSSYAAPDNAAPILTITQASPPEGIAIFGNTLYAANDDNTLTEYSLPSGTPGVTISGSNTDLAAPLGIAVDASGNIYVANGIIAATGTTSVLEFAPNASGNATPIAIITGPPPPAPVGTVVLRNPQFVFIAPCNGVPPTTTTTTPGATTTTTTTVPSTTTTTSTVPSTTTTTSTVPSTTTTTSTPSSTTTTTVPRGGPPGCGVVITNSVKLTTDIGPCLGDGLIIQGNNITINLNGHTIRGGGSDPAAALDQAGIRVDNAVGVTVENGTVRDFFVGVLLKGGSGNTITKITADHNIGLGSTLYNDGIILDGSSNNKVVNNRVTGNGPDAGIAMINGASYNHISHNFVADNHVPTIGAGPGGANQALDSGISNDGGSDYNVISDNEVLRNGFFGIALAGRDTSHDQAIHNTVRDNGSMGINAGGNGHLVQGNTVDHNGYEQFLPPGGLPLWGPIGGVGTCGQVGVPCGPDFTTIQGNTITRNAGPGIALLFNGTQETGGTGNFGTFPPVPYTAPRSNLVQRNIVKGNTGDGIFIECDKLYDANFNSTCLTSTPAHLGMRILNNVSLNNGGPNAGTSDWDLHDQNPNCDHDIWSGNKHQTANPACTTG